MACRSSRVSESAESLTTRPPENSMFFVAGLMGTSPLCIGKSVLNDRDFVSFFVVCHESYVVNSIFWIKFVIPMTKFSLD